MDGSVVLSNVRLKQIEGAQRYAQADRSDPFAFARCMAHIKARQCSGVHKDGGNCHYDATEAKEEDAYIHNGVAGNFQRTIWNNRQRP